MRVFDTSVGSHIMAAKQEYHKPPGVEVTTESHRSYSSALMNQLMKVLDFVSAV